MRKISAMNETLEAARSRKRLSTSRHHRNSSFAKGGDDSETLSNISDAEIRKYINNKKEMQYKRIIWEAMNQDYLKGNKQKRAKTNKKADSTTKDAKKHGVDNVKKLSSKVNYDTLKKLNTEDDEVDKIASAEETNSNLIDICPANERLNSEDSSSGDNTEDEFGNEDRVSNQNINAIQDYHEITDFGLDDDYAGYEEDYDFEEY